MANIGTMIQLDPQAPEPMYWQLYRQIRGLILSGEWEAGDKVPPSRELARMLGVSRVTVAQAYAWLQSEGFVTGKRGAGTFVADVGQGAVFEDERPFTPRLTAWGRRILSAKERAVRGQPRPEIDFGFGRSFPHIFPYDIWRKLLARYLSTDDVMLSRYGSAAGFYPLRQALADRLAHWRGIVCQPEQVVIVNGAQQALDMLLRLLVEPGDEVLMESPGYADAAALFQAHGARLTPVPVDDDGFCTALIAPDSEAVLAFVTPSNQFPRGGAMPLARRLALLRWARQQGAFVVEDDYDGELRYDGRPLSALKSLDEGDQVIYLGTFSKVLFPALRLAYVVLPEVLVRPFILAKGLVDRGAPTLTQAAVADFIAEGHFDRHLHHLRVAYGRRRQALVDALRHYLGDRVSFVSEPAGLHVMVFLPTGWDEETAVAQAEKVGVGIYPAAPYFLQPGPPAILLGFSGLTEAEIVEGIRRLASIL